MLASIINYVVVAILQWIAQLVGVQIKKSVDAAADEKVNAGIQEGLENAKTEDEAQKALDAAAGRLGRHP